MRSRTLDDTSGRGSVVEPGGGQHVGPEDVLAQHRPHPWIHAAALLVARRGERRVFLAVVLGERGAGTPPPRHT